MPRKTEVFGVTVEGDISGLKQAMNEATRLFNSTERSIKNIDKALKLDPSNLDLLRKKQELYTKAIQDGEKALEELLKDQRDITENENFKQGYTDLTERYAELQLKITQVSDKLKNLKSEIKNMPTPQEMKFIEGFQELGNTLDVIGRKTSELSRAFQVLLTASFDSAVQYENQIAGIRKIVSDLSDNTIRDLKDIAVETGTAFEEIAEYATFSGALGLAENQIAGFTKTMIDLNTATGGAFAGEEGAKGLVVFLNNLGIGVEQASNFGSAISEIGDAMADVGDETLQMAISLAGLSTISKVNQYDLIGLAGVMKNLGLRTATSSSALTRSFMAIEQAVATGSSQLDVFAKTANMTSDEFVSAWGRNATDAFLRFVDGIKSTAFEDINNAVINQSEILKDYAEVLGVTEEMFTKMWNEDSAKTLDKFIESMEEMEDTSENASIILKDLKLSGVRTAETLLKLSGQGDNVREAIKMANDAWQKNTALTDKANVMYETTAKKLEGVKEALKQAGSSMMDDVMPAINTSLDVVKKLAVGFSEMPPVARNTALAFASMGAAISPVSKGLSKFIDTLTKVKTANTATLLTANAMVGSITALATAFGTYAYISITNDEMYKLGQTTKQLRTEFDSTKISADQLYASQTALLPLGEEYAQKIKELSEALNDENLSEEKAGEIKQLISQYIYSLNDALGEEAFEFDEATGKITHHGDEVDDLTQKYQNLAFEIRKNSWLDAHKDSLKSSYEMLENAQDGLAEATKYYFEHLQKIPEEYVDLYQKYNGDIAKIKQEIGENTYNQMNLDQFFATIQGTYEEYKRKVQEFQQDMDNANQRINEYQMVSESTAETFDEVLLSMSTSIETLTGDLESDVEKLTTLKEQRELYASALTEEQSTNDELLRLMDEQISDLEQNIEKHGIILGKIQEEKNVSDSMIAKFESFANTESHKSLVIDVVYNIVNSPPPGAGGFSGPFGINSGGFGDLYNSVGRTLQNNKRANINSGGFMSGGVTLNANFTINNGSNITRSVVQGWASSMIDIINDELGGRI